MDLPADVSIVERSAFEILRDQIWELDRADEDSERMLVELFELGASYGLRAALNIHKMVSTEVARGTAAAIAKRLSPDA